MRINPLFTTFVIMTALAFLSLNNKAGALEITTIVQGTVTAIKADAIEILDEQNGKQVWIMINPNTVYDNVQQWSDLKAGDNVQIEYHADHDKSIATTITRIEKENDDEI